MTAGNPTDPRARMQSALALHRFGCGPRPGDIARLADDPKAALLSELTQGVKPIVQASLSDSAAAARAAADFQRQRKAERDMQRLAGTEPGSARENTAAPGPMQPPAADAPQQIYLDEAAARIQHALDADIGFVERLVWFWSNHFCVSADKGPTRAICGAYEREAIRPHVLGKFRDMLRAVEMHPAMLHYLDNVRSFGPGSFAGLRQRKGLNENLAREILELHTLGVRSGYGQDDVTRFAKVITGWTVHPPRREAEDGGAFWFNERMHEPGPQTVLGKAYAQDGLEQGLAVLDMLAAHPATATHIARKLLAHFVTDAPPAALVARLAKRFRDSGGDLLEVTRALVAMPEAWQTPRKKLKRPSEWIVGALRIAGLPLGDVRRVLNAQNLLGEPLWRPPAPKGFSDDSAAWMDGIAQRVDVANQIARLTGNDGREADDLVDAALGPLASAETRQTVRRAESRPQALALLLMSAEFQRR